MRLDDLRRLLKLLDDASGPQDVFMTLRDRSMPADARDRALGAEYRRLRELANPERFMGNPPAQDLAREILTRLEALYQAAPGAVDDPAGTPPSEPPRAAVVEPPRASEPPRDGGSFTVIAGANHYRLDTRVTIGELAAIHRGRCVAGPHAGTEVAAKVALDRGDDPLILAEIQALQLLAHGEASQRSQVPALLDVFFKSGPCGHSGVLLRWLDGLDGASLRARFTAGVPPEHVIWIGRRLLSVTGYAHKLGVIHANIEPAHVIVRPHDHHVTLIDWCYSVIDPARTHQRFRVYNPAYSAPEVAESKPPLPAADLYSIGRCMLFLLGGDLATGAVPDAVPDRLRRFVAYLTRPSPLQRPQDAFEMFHELDRTRAQIYGAHRFVELVVP
ncbi:MAG TPA: hypothetical protein VGB85_30710 [Nannocystis sp.]|jgi:serine/threonine protein kinase